MMGHKNLSVISLIGLHYDLFSVSLVVVLFPPFISCWVAWKLSQDPVLLHLSGVYGAIMALQWRNDLLGVVFQYATLVLPKLRLNVWNLGYMALSYIKHTKIQGFNCNVGSICHTGVCTCHEVPRKSSLKGWRHWNLGRYAIGKTK